MVASPGKVRMHIENCTAYCIIWRAIQWINTSTWSNGRPHKNSRRQQSRQRLRSYPMDRPLGSRRLDSWTTTTISTPLPTATRTEIPGIKTNIMKLLVKSYASAWFGNKLRICTKKCIAHNMNGKDTVDCTAYWNSHMHPISSLRTKKSAGSQF